MFNLITLLGIIILVAAFILAAVDAPIWGIFLLLSAAFAEGIYEKVEDLNVW